MARPGEDVDVLFLPVRESSYLDGASATGRAVALVWVASGLDSGGDANPVTGFWDKMADEIYPDRAIQLAMNLLIWACMWGLTSNVVELHKELDSSKRPDKSVQILQVACRTPFMPYAISYGKAEYTESRKGSNS